MNEIPVRKTFDWRIPFLLISAAIIALDRWTKTWVTHHIPEGHGRTVIRNVFRITHVLNPGAAFSLFTGTAHPNRTHWLLTGFSVIAAVAVLAVLLRIGRRFTLTALSLALILGGAIGNAWDRIQYSVVTDFLEVHIIHYHWPDFNIADSAIVCGGILLLLDALRGTKTDIS
jgi:signal peptidase II